jgi:hypothetical protein
MTSQAAIDGIYVNGLAWQSSGPRISRLCKLIGEYNDRLPEDNDDASRLVETILAIGNAIDEWATGLDTEFREDFLVRHGDDLDFLREISLEDMTSDSFESTLSDVTDALNELYDTFDYHRILVK